MKRFRRSAIASAFHDTAPELRRKTIGLFVALLITTLFLWILVVGLSFASSAAVLSIALIAYSLGVSHSFDGASIAALNATTYALVQERKRPVALAVFFSLGYATGIAILCLVLASLDTLDAVPAITFLLTILGTAASSVFLIGTAWKILPLPPYRGAFKGIHLKSTREMVLVGAVFSLPLSPSLFLGVVTLSALVALSGLTLWSIALFAALFWVGMATIQSVNVCLMTTIYWQALTKPMAIPDYGEALAGYTGIAALFVAFFELGSTLVSLLDLHTPFSEWLVSLRDNTGLLGVVLFVVFLVGWAGVTLWTRVRVQALGQNDSFVRAARADKAQDNQDHRQEEHSAATLPLGAKQDED